MEQKSTKRKRWDDAYSRYVDKLYRVLYKYAEEDRFLDDVVHDTFLDYYDNMDKIEDDMIFVWLSHVAINSLKSLYRREGKCLLNSSYASALREEEQEVPSAEDEYLEKDMCREIRKFRRDILDKLKEENPLWHEVIMKMCVMGMTAKEVAREQGVSNYVIYARLHRARDWIKKSYKEEGIEKFEKGASYEETP